MVDAYEDPGTPDCRGGGRYLWWLVGSQPGRAAAGALLGTVWMVLMALTPYLLSRAIDDGLEPGDQAVLAGWSAALLGLGVFNAWLSIMRHRTMTRLRMDANFRTVKLVVGQATRLGAALPRRTGAGEVVTIGVGDVADDQPVADRRRARAWARSSPTSWSPDCCCRSRCRWPRWCCSGCR